MAVMGKELRLDKYLTEMNLGTRSQMKEAAKKGRIQVNGAVEKKTDRKIDPDRDTVSFDGRMIRYNKFEYYMLHKPDGVVSATEDRIHPTVTGLLGPDVRKDLFPVGRLDIDTEGLLLMTNDGELAHRLLSPKKHVDKVYYAEVEGRLPKDAVRRMEAGLTLTDGTPVKPAKLVITDFSDEGSKVLLTIREGKFHQVKRMFEALDCRVSYLKRMSMGTLKLDESLKPGEFRPLTERELKELKELTNYDDEE
ncbi:pseudouridine synthase [Clostridium sp. MCC353]|nr:pseudouridine synthase [Clostridium sp. MCC353]